VKNIGNAVLTNDLLSLIRKLFKPFKKTILHPQWLSYRDNVLKVWLTTISHNSRVLDIGCNDRWPTKFIGPSCEYFGLDYFDTAMTLYGSKVDLYGDAQDLPLCSESIDCVLMFDVLEHIPDAQRALQEVNRVLINGGEVLVQIPFIYPIHDAPLDFRRPTIYGLKRMFVDAGFEVIEASQRGEPIETASLLFNIAMASKVASLLKTKWTYFTFFLFPLVFLVSIVLNVIGWLASCSSHSSSLMPFSYQIKLRKTSIDGNKTL
jgi:SAM-dependent methyltransferase